MSAGGLELEKDSPWGAAAVGRVRAKSVHRKNLLDKKSNSYYILW